METGFKNDISRKNTSDVPRLFTECERQQVLDWLLEDLRADERVAGIVIAGSGSVGFRDRFSDIDLCVAVFNEDEKEAVFTDWKKRLEEKFSILHMCETSNSVVHSGFILLSGFLGVDMFFTSIDKLHARRESWAVAWDRTSKMVEIMQRTWENRKRTDPRRFYQERLDYVWHFIISCAVAVRRGWYWEAVETIGIIRSQAVELAFLCMDMEPKQHHKLDQLPPEFLSRLEGALVKSVGAGEIIRALNCAVDCFFESARALDVKFGMAPAVKLEKDIHEVLQLVEK